MGLQEHRAFNQAWGKLQKASWKRCPFPAKGVRRRVSQSGHRGDKEFHVIRNCHRPCALTIWVGMLEEVIGEARMGSG